MFSPHAQNSMNKAEKYGNFHTIDWLKDQAKDRFRHKWLTKEKVLIFQLYFIDIINH